MQNKEMCASLCPGNMRLEVEEFWLYRGHSLTTYISLPTSQLRVFCLSHLNGVIKATSAMPVKHIETGLQQSLPRTQQCHSSQLTSTTSLL